MPETGILGSYIVYTNCVLFIKLAVASHTSQVVIDNRLCNIGNGSKWGCLNQGPLYQETTKQLLLPKCIKPSFTHYMIQQPVFWLPHILADYEICRIISSDLSWSLKLEFCFAQTSAHTVKHVLVKHFNSYLRQMVTEYRLSEIYILLHMSIPSDNILQFSFHLKCCNVITWVWHKTAPTSRWLHTHTHTHKHTCVGYKHTLKPVLSDHD